MKISSYYRKITELFPKGVKKTLLKQNLYSFFTLFLLLAGVFLTITVYLLAVKYYAVRQKRDNLLDSLTKWERITAIHPNYPDAYFEAAFFAYEVRHKNKALHYISRALVLDPGFLAAQKLKKLIESRN